MTKYYAGRNEKAKAINTYLKANTSLGYTYIDIASSLMNKNGDLASKYTNDGIHLLPSAYKKWEKIINVYF